MAVRISRHGKLLFFNMVLDRFCDDCLFSDGHAWRWSCAEDK